MLNFYSNVAAAKNISQGATRHINIQGSPYSSDEFIKGKVVFKKGVYYKNIPLRYNIYNQEMEFEKNKTAYAINNSSEIQSVQLGSDIYIYTNFKAGKIKETFFLLLADGKCKLLARQQVELIAAQELGAYSEASPARFKRKSNLLYIKIDENPAIIVKKKKDLLKIFSNKETEIVNFMKENKISAKKVEDLKKVVEYYNSINIEN